LLHAGIPKIVTIVPFQGPARKRVKHEYPDAKGPRRAVYTGKVELRTAAEQAARIVIACDKREAFAQGSKATKQSILSFRAAWIASLRSQ
jgi:hypothetical protein